MVEFIAQLSEIDAEIKKAQLRLHLIKKIKQNKISIPSLAGVEVNQTSTVFDKLYSGTPNHNFIEKDHIKVSNHTFEHFGLMATPNFVTESGEIVTKAVFSLEQTTRRFFA